MGTYLLIDENVTIFQPKVHTMRKRKPASFNSKRRLVRELAPLTLRAGYTLFLIVCRWVGKRGGWWFVLLSAAGACFSGFAAGRAIGDFL